MLKPNEWNEKYTGYLLKYALTKIHDRELARDLVQDTFLSGLEMISRFENKSSEMTWLTAILKYKIFMIYRKQAADVVQLSQEFPHPTLNYLPGQHHDLKSLAHFYDHNDPLIAKEFYYRLRHSVNSMPRVWQSVFTMKYCDGESTDLICETLKLSPSNYWIICHRTRLNLKSGFLKYWN
jgi:RNA polymerase sigma factor (sigma-70 family)